MQEGEHDSISPNAQGQDKYHDATEQRVLAQHAQAIGEVLPQLFNEYQPTSITTFLFDLLYAAKVADRGVTSLLRAHAFGDVLADLVLQMKTQFLTEVIFHPTPLQQSFEA